MKVLKINNLFQIKQISKLAVIAVLTLGFLGCKTIKFKNGEVPTEYISQAKNLEGQYKGFFNILPGTLSVTFINNKPVLKWQGDSNQDFTDNGCETKFGNLLEAQVKSGVIRSVTFALRPQFCSIQGKDLTLEIVKQDGAHVTLAATVVSHYEPRRRCETVIVPGPNGSVREQCTTDWVPVYIRGRFSK